MMHILAQIAISYQGSSKLQQQPAGQGKFHNSHLQNLEKDWMNSAVYAVQ